MGAIQFIENLDRTVLTISDEEFERNVEEAVSAIAERQKTEPAPPRPQVLSEKSGPSKPEVTPRNSMDAERHHNSRNGSSSDTVEGFEEKAAVGSLLRTIQRPLSSIGRIFSDDIGSPQFSGTRMTQVSLPPETPRRLSPAVFQPPRTSEDQGRSEEEARRARSPRLSAEDAAARQASAEAAEAQRIQRAEHKDVVELVTCSSFRVHC